METLPVIADLDRTLARITAAAVEAVPDVRFASITVCHEDGRLDTVAPTDDLLLDLDAAQYALREGPCYEAVRDSVHVIAPHLASDDRFPRYAPVAVAAGIRSMAGLRLFDTGEAQGALNLYGVAEGCFEDLDTAAELFAHQSAMALDYAREVRDLEEALRGRTVIGQAVGILMERFRLDDARAFGFLVRQSQQENIKVRVLAEELVAKSLADYGTAS